MYQVIVKHHRKIMIGLTTIALLKYAHKNESRVKQIFNLIYINGRKIDMISHFFGMIYLFYRINYAKFDKNDKKNILDILILGYLLISGLINMKLYMHD